MKRNSGSNEREITYYLLVYREKKHSNDNRFLIPNHGGQKETAQQFLCDERKKNYQLKILDL